MLGVPDGTEITVQPLDEDRLGYYFQPVEIDARAYRWRSMPEPMQRKRPSACRG